MFQSDFGIIADYFAKRWKGYTTIENHKPIKHVDEMLKFMRIFAEDERFLQLDIKKNDFSESWVIIPEKYWYCTLKNKYYSWT